MGGKQVSEGIIDVIKGSGGDLPWRSCLTASVSDKKLIDFLNGLWRGFALSAHSGQTAIERFLA
jgi:hypothetical protein